MVGMVLVAHGGLSEEFIRTAGMILGRPLERVIGVAINAMDDPQYISDQIGNALKKVDDGDGVVIFTDMFGGTPSNVALTFLSEGRVEVISGMNLPMLLKVVESREGANLSDLAVSLKSTGREHISLASDILHGNGN
jgi:mannose PTS system EIIA component